MAFAKILFRSAVILCAVGLCFVGTCTAQQIASDVDRYMNALVKLNRFTGSVLIARNAEVP